MWLDEDIGKLNPLDYILLCRLSSIEELILNDWFKQGLSLIDWNFVSRDQSSANIRVKLNTINPVLELLDKSATVHSFLEVVHLDPGKHL